METIKKLVDEKFDYFNRWLNDSRISDDTYTMIYNQIYELQNEIKKLVDEKFQEKDKEFGLLLADRDKLEIYRHNRLKKSDFEIEVEFGSGDWTGYSRRNKYILKNSSKYESLED